MTYPRRLYDITRADFLNSVGLYIMRNRLCLVRMRKNLFSISLVGEGLREITSGDDPGLRKKAFSEAISSFLPHFNPAKDPFYIAISPDQAITCQVFLPQAAEENLKQVLDYEIERLLPFRREEVYYDFLPAGRKENKISLILFAIPKKFLDEIMDTLSAFGIKPKGIEIATTASSNYTIFCKRDMAGPALLLGGDGNGWEMIGLNTRKDYPGNGTRLLFAHWLPKEEWIQGPARELFQGFLRESPRLFGWGETNGHFFSKEDESPQMEDLLEIGRERAGRGRWISDPSYIPAIGAALRGLREARFHVNLLPKASNGREEGNISRLNTLLGILLIAELIIWGGSYLIKDEILLHKIQKETQRLKPAIESITQKDEEIKRLGREISFLSGLNEQKGTILQVLDELSNVVPNSAYLSTLRYQNGAVELQGSAEKASDLVPLLERSALFKNVGFNAPSNRGQDNRETFSLKAEAERPEGRTTRP